MSNSVRILHHGHLTFARSVLLDLPVGAADPLCHAPSYSYLIRTAAGRNILFDAAISPRHLSEWPQAYLDRVGYVPTEEQMFEARLKAAGLGPEDVDILILSHLHCDHAGNARLFASVDTTILVQQRELAAVAQLATDERFYVRADFDIPSRRITPIDGGQEIDEGLSVLPLPGHTSGSMGLVVDTQRSGTLIFTSDACYLAESFDSERPEARPENREQWIESMSKLKERARATAATVLFGHDHETRCERHGRAPLAGHVDCDTPYA